MTLYQKKPLQVEAVQWTGGNVQEMKAFAGESFDTNAFRLGLAATVSDAAVYDLLHRGWILVKLGDWVIRGVQGELYPCDKVVFAQTYEEAS